MQLDTRVMCYPGEILHHRGMVAGAFNSIWSSDIVSSNVAYIEDSIVSGRERAITSTR